MEYWAETCTLGVPPEAFRSTRTLLFHLTRPGLHLSSHPRALTALRFPSPEPPTLLPGSGLVGLPLQSPAPLWVWQLMLLLWNMWSLGPTSSPARGSSSPSSPQCQPWVFTASSCNMSTPIFIAQRSSFSNSGGAVLNLVYSAEWLMLDLDLV